MNTINRYIENQRAYIAKKKVQPLIGFTNAQGEPASWNDIVVKFTYSNTSTMNIYFCNKNKKNPKISTFFTVDDRLTPETHDMLFSYVLDIIKEDVSIKHKNIKISSARHFLALLEENIALIPHEKIQHIINSMSYKTYLIPFINWLHHHKMLPKSCQPKINVIQYRQN